jgi:hypothetical protein
VMVIVWAVLYVGVSTCVYLDQRRPRVAHQWHQQVLGLPRPCRCRRGHGGGYFSREDVEWHNQRVREGKPA